MSVRRTIEDIADGEDAVADNWDEMTGGSDETDFLRADAIERRRLAEIIRAEEKRELKELEEWRNSLITKKRKKVLKAL